MQVREYAWFTTDHSATSGQDLAVVSRSTFDWLASLQHDGAPVTEYHSGPAGKRLQLRSLVGFLKSPDGTAIEVLPKTESEPADTGKVRMLLQRMLRSALHLNGREYGPANLERFDLPLHEWIFRQFLEALKQLVARGLRFDYERIEENARFLRGQLQMAKQLRQPPGKAAEFHIAHDIFSPDRVENRLIKTALVLVQNACRESDNWRLANEFSHRLEEIPVQPHALAHLAKWRDGKLMQRYRAIRPWCELILEQLSPTFTQGLHRGIAMLFPMEKLFENYVATRLQHQLTPHWKLNTQVAALSLTTHTPEKANEQQAWFRLKPDLLLKRGPQQQVLDTKWKLLNSQKANGSDKYQISEHDLYQMLAYGVTYQNGVGHMMLIYPRHHHFCAPLPLFHLPGDLVLWAVPFCLDSHQLISGEWQSHFPGLIDTETNNRLAS